MLKDIERVLLTWLRAFLDLVLPNESACCSLLMLLLFVIDPLKSIRGFNAFRTEWNEVRWALFTFHQRCALTGTTLHHYWNRHSPKLRKNSQSKSVKHRLRCPCVDIYSTKGLVFIKHTGGNWSQLTGWRQLDTRTSKLVFSLPLPISSIIMPMTCSCIAAAPLWTSAHWTYVKCYHS